MALLGAIIGGAASLIGGALDNRRAKKNRQAEEARLRAATGYDFVKLRDQATAAGFNPLTVLQATGGAGYDGRGAVVSQPYSPFIQGALTGAVSSYFDLRESDRRFALDSKRDEMLSREIDRIGSAFGGSSAFGAPASVMVSQAREAAGSPFDMSLARKGTYPEDWWRARPSGGVQDRDMFTRFSSFGNVTVVPEGPDFESALSGLWIEATNKAKQKGYIPPDAERTMYDDLTEFGANAIGGARVMGTWVSRLGGGSYW